MEKIIVEENEEIKVSVICTAYNAEKYIKKCLESILGQETSFKYEVIVHDDASTDNTAKIIKKLEGEYPDKIKAIYQKENQYSKGIDIIKMYMFPRCQGKYIAMCEGDDYWINSRKLQIQYDYMEAHKNISLCAHNTIRRNLQNLKKDKLFNSWKTCHVLSEADTFFGWNIHTSSYMLKKECLESSFFEDKFWAGDYKILTVAYDMGKVVSLPNIMSVYNYNNIEGVLYIMKHQSIQSHIAKIDSRKQYLQDYDLYTSCRHHEIVEERIKEINFSVEKERVDYKFFDCKYGKEVISRCRKIRKEEYYKKYLSSLSLKAKIWTFMQYSGNPILYWVTQWYNKK